MDNNHQLTTPALNLPIPADRFAAASKLHGQLHRWRLLVRKHWWVLALVFSMPVPVWWLTLNARPAYESKARMWLTGKLDIQEGRLYTEELLNYLGTQTELLRSQYVQGVTAAGQRIGNNFHQWGFKVKGDTGVFDITPSNVNVDYDYLTVYGIQLKEGRGFSKEFATDNGMAFIINESFAKELGLKQTIGTPAGHSWYKNDSLGKIIGVVKDFNFNSLHYKVNTLEMVVHPDWGYDEMSVKIDGAHMEEAIAFVKETWDKQITAYPFDYSFLDSHFELLYRSDQQMSAVVTIMASLAILISCMGLFGLAAITTEKKTKEIGIRKVLGATETQITVLLSKNFTWLIIISFVAVSPITYWLLSGWLESFAYRVDIGVMIFVVAGASIIIITLLTISFQSIRAAMMNPVNSLRSE